MAIDLGNIGNWNLFGNQAPLGPRPDYQEYADKDESVEETKVVSTASEKAEATAKAAEEAEIALKEAMAKAEVVAQ